MTFEYGAHVILGTSETVVEVALASAPPFVPDSVVLILKSSLGGQKEVRLEITDSITLAEQLRDAAERAKASHDQHRNRILKAKALEPPPERSTVFDALIQDAVWTCPCCVAVFNGHQGECLYCNPAVQYETKKQHQPGQHVCPSKGASDE